MKHVLRIVIEVDPPFQHTLADEGDWDFFRTDIMTDSFCLYGDKYGPLNPDSNKIKSWKIVRVRTPKPKPGEETELDRSARGREETRIWRNC